MGVQRIIARLDIKGDNLVKGVHLEGLRVLGKPWSFAKYYYENGADELIFQDVVASLYGRNCLHEIITKTAKEIFIPLTVGGGLRSIDDIGDAFLHGADKVSLNTAAIKNPDLIENAVKIFGSSNIVVAIEAIKQTDGNYFSYIDNGREHTGCEVVEWAKKIEQLGAGEILLTSVDRDGTGTGFDIDLNKSVSDSVNIPVIAHGGASTIAHIESAFNETSIDAVALASIIHYGSLHNFEKVNQQDYHKEGNIDFIKKPRKYKNFGVECFDSIKSHLSKEGIECREI